MRNPDWTRDETILLMELYRGAPRAARSHPGVVALSLVLRAAARRDGRSVSDTFRNPAGIAMRLRNFAKHDPSAPVGRDAGLRPGGAVDAAVWRDLSGDATALAAEVARIRLSIAADDWTLGAKTSRGPAPSFGSRSMETADGRAYVYLLLVDGPIDVLSPQSLFEDLHRPSPSVSCSNTNSAWRGGVESRCGRTGIGRAMKRV